MIRDKAPKAPRLRYYGAHKTNPFRLDVRREMKGLGEYYPRMARPTIDDISNSPGINPESQASKVVIETGLGQLVAFISNQSEF